MTLMHQITIYNEDDSDADDIPEDDVFIEYYRPCPTCSPNNGFGYVCPIPILENVSRLDEPYPVGHTWCTGCRLLIPTRGVEEEKCSTCNRYVCQGFGGPNSRCAYPTVKKFGGIEVYDMTWLIMRFQF